MLPATQKSVAQKISTVPKSADGSALLTVAGFGHPDMMVEIQAIAVIDS
jgi:hypothetical protein